MIPVLVILLLLLAACLYLNYYVKKKGEIHYDNGWLKLDITKKPDYIEMNASPTPEWIRSAGKEIQEQYNLDSIERIYISGIICKHKRLNK